MIAMNVNLGKIYTFLDYLYGTKINRIGSATRRFLLKVNLYMCQHGILYKICKIQRREDSNGIKNKMVDYIDSIHGWLRNQQ